MALIEIHLFSEILGMDMEVNVILPQELQPYKQDDKFKVLWLLHGGSGDSTAWLRMTSIERYALEYGIAVVLPNAMNSCFTNMAHGGCFFTYITEELPVLLRHMLPQLSDLREDNYISGVSNGGYGCFRIGLARPDLYAAIGAFCAGDKSDAHYGPERAREKELLFGEGSLKGTENDLKFLGQKAVLKNQPLPQIYHACGTLDPWLDLNHLMRNFFYDLPGNPYNYQYHEIEGYGHNWDLFDQVIESFFKFLGFEKCTGKYFGM